MIVEVRGLPSGIATAQISKRVEIVMFDGMTPKDVFNRAKEVAKAQGIMHITGMQADALHQCDTQIIGGMVHSHEFDRLREPPDWSKLPDWPAWSATYAREPLGVF